MRRRCASPDTAAQVEAAPLARLHGERAAGDRTLLAPRLDGAGVERGRSRHSGRRGRAGARRRDGARARARSMAGDAGRHRGGPSAGRRPARPARPTRAAEDRRSPRACSHRSPSVAPSVERVADISYGDAGRWNTLDVYRHRSRPSGCPTLVYLHGGGFRSGRKNREARLLLYRLAGRGWICISANYRLSPAAEFPDHLVDVKKVIAWVGEPGRGYGADPSTLVVAGSSAGGNLAATAALTPNDPRFQPGFEDAETVGHGRRRPVRLLRPLSRRRLRPGVFAHRLHPGGCAAVLHRAR